ncbi:MAG: AmpG family muropeptide MFS transporter [Gammaproteobacteria bacterium]|nr:AmpG family muropeptide MFS transporter [Gammaproteobacteria bacterium]MDH3766846.1 AmpG family muropeptide MFS transporter [Gammaproteobacteria bacterium]
MAETEIRRSWVESLRLYSQPRVIGISFLGFSAGLPYLLVFSTLSAYLRDVDVSRSTIGYFGLVGTTYSIKVFWAPLIDRLRIPLLTKLLGKRRSWMLLAQAALIAGLAAMALTDPTDSLAVFALLAVFVAFASATQDVAIDAWRIEAVPRDWQGIMAAGYVFGYRFALLVSGAGALYIADFISWSAAYLVMAVLLVVGVATTLLISEPEITQDRESVMLEQRVIDFMGRRAHWPEIPRRLAGWFVGAVVGPFLDFFKRYGHMALAILVFIGIYRISDITMGIMANPFYLDLGFSKSEIASIAKVFGFVMTITGAALGGLLVARFGFFRPLLLGAVLVAVTNLLFAYMASVDKSLQLLALVISADNLSGGIAIAAFIAYLSSLTNVAYTATQYALFSSLMTLPAKLVSGISGVIVDSYGYIWFFVYASAIGVPAILLVLYLMHLANSDASGGDRSDPVSDR